MTIVPRGQALGVTYQRPQTDRYNYPEAYLRARIIGMLGGRAAEEVVYGTRTTGAENDIQQATELARQMVTRWGMSDRLGMVQLAPRREPVPRSARGPGRRREAVQRATRAQLIDSEVQRIIGSATTRRRRCCRRIASASTRWSAALLERETLDEEEILRVTGLPPAPPLQNEAIIAAAEQGVAM